MGSGVRLGGRLPRTFRHFFSNGAVLCRLVSSGVARAPQAPRPRGGAAGLKRPARDPPGRSSRRNPLARGPNKLCAGGPKNRRYATACFLI